MKITNKTGQNIGYPGSQEILLRPGVNEVDDNRWAEAKGKSQVLVKGVELKQIVEGEEFTATAPPPEQQKATQVAGIGSIGKHPINPAADMQATSTTEQPPSSPLTGINAPSDRDVPGEKSSTGKAAESNPIADKKATDAPPPPPKTAAEKAVETKPEGKKK